MIQKEHDIQVAICHLLDLYKIFYFSVPNGIHFNRDKLKAIKYARKLKSEGFRSGASDLVVLTKEKPYFIEVKTEKGKQSENQKAFQKDIENLGYIYLLWRSIDSAENWIKEINNGKNL